MTRFLVVAVVLASTSLVAPSAEAQTPPPTISTSTTESPPTVWYGWQTLASDTPAAIAAVASYTTDNRALQPILGLSAVAVYLVVPPVVHIAHGRGKVAAFDLALRLGLPFVGAAVAWGVGTVADTHHDDLMPLAYGAWGLIVGGAGAAVIDATAFAHERGQPQPPTTALSWTPTVTRVGNGAIAGISGQF